VKRHATVDELALLGADCMKPRRAAKLKAHMAACAQCTQLSNELVAVPNVLASASVAFPPMPEQFSARIDTALAAEATNRLASEPATEAGRRDLPARSGRAGQTKRGWRLPGFSVPATRVLAAVGALVIISAGSYEVAAHVGNNLTSSSSSSAGAAAPSAQTRPLTFGPALTYKHGGVFSTIRTVRTNFDFVRAQLVAQAVAAVRTARLKGAISAPGTRASSVPAASAGTTKASSNAVNRPGSNVSQLTGCIGLVAANQSLLLVEVAYYEGHPATIIVLAATSSRPAEVLVAGQACSQSRRDILVQLTLPHL
jgi:hypothetical protein